MKEWFQALPRSQREGVPYLLLAIAVFAAYANVYHNAFVYDDVLLIVRNKFLRSWDNLPDLLMGLGLSGAGRADGFYRPLQMLLYFFACQIFGPSPPAFHALNIILHAADACLVCRLGRRIGLRPWVSFAAALLWAVHPLHTEAVTYISGTADPLYCFFCLLGLVVLLPDFAPRKFWLASLLFVLALASKESAVVFPALATITLFLVSEDRLRPATYVRTWPLWLLAAVYVTGWLTYIHVNGFTMYDSHYVVYSRLYAHNFANRVLTCLATMPVYFHLVIWPAGLHMKRPFPIFTTFWDWQVMAGVALAVLAVLQILCGKARRRLALSWGLLWFAAAYSPNSGIMMPVDALILEHWMYLPTVGCFLGIAHSASAWLDRKPEKARVMATVLVAVAALALGIKTYLQNESWQTPVTFYENIVRNGGRSGQVYESLGLLYMQQGQFEKAIEQFRKAIARPDLASPALMVALHVDLATAYLRVNRDVIDGQSQIRATMQVLPLATQIPEAIEELNKAVELDPDYFWANEILALIYAHQGDNEKASYYGKRAAAASARDSSSPASLN